MNLADYLTIPLTAAFFLFVYTTPSIPREQPQHWQITIRHANTFYGQGEHYQLVLRGSAPNPNSCYREILLDTSFGPIRIETPKEWENFGFGCSRATSILEATVTIGAVWSDEGLGEEEHIKEGKLIIYKAIAKTVGSDIVDITNDLVEEPFRQLQIKIQPRQAPQSEPQLRQRLQDMNKMSRDLGT